MDNEIVRKLEKLRSICLVLGEDFQELVEKQIGLLPEDDDYSKKLDLAVEKMSFWKTFKISQSRDLADRIIEYWDLLCIPLHERKGFTYLLCWMNGVSDDLVNDPNQLSSAAIGQMTAELGRVEDICWVRISEKMRVLEKYKKLAGLDVPSSASQPLGQDDGDELDAISRLRSIKRQIKDAKGKVSSRVGITTRAVIVLNAVEEVKWFWGCSNRAQVIMDANSPMNERAIKAQNLSQKILGMLEELEVQVLDWSNTAQRPFMYGKENLITIIKIKTTEVRASTPGRQSRDPQGAVNPQLHQSTCNHAPVNLEQDTHVRVNPQRQQVEAQAEGNPTEGLIIQVPMDMHVPRRARTPRVPAEPQPAGPLHAPMEPSQPAGPPHVHPPNFTYEEDNDDPNDPDYAP
ncbi:uncharacterized protein LOC107304239 [Oryza brachyantha]|uniref:Uncharacterized protein n=1 Tax=Oryza brachyantha TaxID=4533 RepID=J3M9A5_ORYBR|nr:uncharacterized protein LOC107304239 [Oryza brachyantha]